MESCPARQECQAVPASFGAPPHSHLTRLKDTPPSSLPPGFFCKSQARVSLWLPGLVPQVVFRTPDLVLASFLEDPASYTLNFK